MHMEDLRYADRIFPALFIGGIIQELFALRKQVRHFLLFAPADNVVFFASAAIIERCLVFDGDPAYFTEILAAFAFEGIYRVWPFTEIETL